MSFDNLKHFMENQEEFGMGDSVSFDNTPAMIDKAIEELTAYASVSLIFKRSDALSLGDEQQFNDWFEQLKSEDSFMGYMTNNFKFSDGKFIIPNDIQSLDAIAKHIINS